jgi:hypothetical protein
MHKIGKKAVLCLPLAYLKIEEVLNKVKRIVHE